MALTNYQPPALSITEIQDNTSTASVAPAAACVVGTQYILSRFGKETLPSYSFASAGASIGLQYIDSNGITKTLVPTVQSPVTASLALYGKGLEGHLATLNSTIYLDDASKPHIIKLTDGSYFGASSLNSAFYGRPVAPGDVVYTNDGTTTVRRRVVSLIGKNLASTYGTDSGNSNTYIANAAINPPAYSHSSHAGKPNPLVQLQAPGDYVVTIDDSTLFDITKGSRIGTYAADQFTVVVATGGAPGTATVNISSASGLFSATGVATTNSSGAYVITSAAFNGPTVTLTGTGSLSSGQVFKFQIYGDYVLNTHTNLVLGGTYNGPANTTYFIKVTTASSGSSPTGAVVQIFDSANIDAVSTVTVTATTVYALGSYGLTFEFASCTNNGLRLGDTFYVNAVAVTQSTTLFDRVALDGPAVNANTFNITNPVACEFRLCYTGQLTSVNTPTSSAPFSITNTTLAYVSGLSDFVSSRTSGHQLAAFVDGIGTLSVAFSAIVLPTNSENKIPVNTLSDITSNFGLIDPDNELAYAVWAAFVGAASGNVTVYGLRVNGDDSTSHTKAGKKIFNTDTVYALALMSTNPTIQAQWMTHVNSASGPKIKNFRKLYTAVDSPGVQTLLKSGGSNNYSVTVSVFEGTYTHVTFFGSPDLTTLNLYQGDYILIPSIGGVTEFRIQNVISATEVILMDDVGTPILSQVPVELYKADTVQNTSDYVTARAKSFANKRVVLGWTESAVYNGVSISAKYLMAEFAGVRSNTVPQLPLSSYQLQTVTSVSSIYTNYDIEDLNVIASNGVLIFAQDSDAGAVYVRHQLTTDTVDGPLASEDSALVNLDNLAFRMKAALSEYKGNVNITSGTLAEIKSALKALFTTATQTSFSVDSGPQIDSFDPIKVTQNPILRDHVNVYVKVHGLLPMNNIDAVLEEDVALVVATA